MTTTDEEYLLKSNFDDTIFKVNQKVIISSILLKNMSELSCSNPLVPIGVDCSGDYLKKFVDFIQIQDENKNDEEKYILKVNDLFKDFNSDNELAGFIKEICILDSDILLDALADFILNKIKNMSQEEICKYLEIENDFSHLEREWQNENALEYFISLNDPSFPLKFPLQTSQNFYSIKTKFFSPLNILLSRICQRSNESIAFKLSLCSKALKNECDRYPIKVSRMFIQIFKWCFEIKQSKNMTFAIKMKKENESYFLAICKRRVMVWNDNLEFLYGHLSFSKEQFDVFKKHSFSLEWIIPHKNIQTIEVSFSDHEIFVSTFDLTKFNFSNVRFYISFSGQIDFDFVYKHLIAKDLSKEVKLHFVNFSQHLSMIIHKKANASKFYKCTCHFPTGDESLPPKFIEFLKNYMESDGRIEFRTPHPVIPEKIIHTCSQKRFMKYCNIYDLLKYLS